MFSKKKFNVKQRITINNNAFIGVLKILTLKENLIELLKVLADTTRLEILELLKNREEEKSATEIQNALNRSQSTISQQLKILVNADLISVRRESRKKLYKVKYPQIFKILKAMNSFISKRNKDKIDKLTDLDILDTLY